MDEAKKATLRMRLRELYEGHSERAHRFRSGILAFDVVTITFIVLTTFFERQTWMEIADVAIGLVVLADFSARLFACPRPMREFMRPSTWADVVAIISFLSPIVGEGAAFLRILRTLRLLRTYQMLSRLRSQSRVFRRHEELILATVNMFVFLFIMTSIIYQTQHWKNAQINNYVDALYFTVTSLTTTGFGDITLQGTSGRLLSIVVMIVGVGLFLRLAQVIFRPSKVRFPCPVCGLQRHESDAVHCKACGTVLNIPDEGLD